MKYNNIALKIDFVNMKYLGINLTQDDQNLNIDKSQIISEGK